MLVLFQAAMNIAKIQKVCYKEKGGTPVPSTIFLQFSCFPQDINFFPPVLPQETSDYNSLNRTMSRAHL